MNCSYYEKEENRVFICCQEVNKSIDWLDSIINQSQCRKEKTIAIVVATKTLELVFRQPASEAAEA